MSHRIKNAACVAGGVAIIVGMVGCLLAGGVLATLTEGTKGFRKWFPLQKPE